MAELRRPYVVVLGSVHMDLIATAERLPGPGESVAGGAFTMAPGGKGGNQACQFVLAGAHASVISRLGNDLFGRELLEAMRSRGVDTSLIAIDSKRATGASTVLAAGGDYASIIAPGAAAHLNRGDVDRARSAIERADALVLQLELPIEVSAYAAEIALSSGAKVVLNASPAPASRTDIPATMWSATGMLVVNRVEAGRLLGAELRTDEAGDAVVELSRCTGVDCVVITLGVAGAIASDHGSLIVQPAFESTVIDTVGAGDAFLGLLVTSVLEGLPIGRALERGAAAGALAVGKSGAYAALPARDEVDAFLEHAQEVRRRAADKGPDRSET